MLFVSGSAVAIATNPWVFISVLLPPRGHFMPCQGYSQSVPFRTVVLKKKVRNGGKTKAHLTLLGEGEACEC